MLHAAFILVFMVALAPLASFIPLSALAGVLVVVCWNMAEKRKFVALFADWRTALVLITTLVLTLVKDLTFGIVSGCLIAGLFALIHRAIPSEDGP
jgi:SulP family sulfate permease